MAALAALRSPAMLCLCEGDAAPARRAVVARPQDMKLIHIITSNILYDIIILYDILYDMIYHMI